MPEIDDDDEDDDMALEQDPSHRFSRYQQKVGSGRFKRVYRGFDEKNGIDVAWSKIERHVNNMELDDETMERITAEMSKGLQLEHPNIIKCFRCAALSFTVSADTQHQLQMCEYPRPHAYEKHERLSGHVPAERTDAAARASWILPLPLDPSQAVGAISRAAHAYKASAMHACPLLSRAWHHCRFGEARGAWIHVCMFCLSIIAGSPLGQQAQVFTADAVLTSAG